MGNPKDDITKYLKGELSPAEMHALEKKALEDSFLGDALEGAGDLGVEDFDADVDLLQGRLEKRIAGNEGRVVSLWVWSMRIAAGLALVAIATFTIIRLAGNRPSERLAINKETVVPTEKNDAGAVPESSDTAQEIGKDLLSLAKPEEPKSIADVRPPAGNKAAENPISSSSQPAAAAEEPAQPAPELEASDDRDIAAEITTGDKAKIAATAPIETRREEAETAKKSEPTLAKDVSRRARKADQKAAAGAAAVSSAADEAPSNIIRGQVRSQDGSPLPGVNVIIKGTNEGTVTDALGNYQLAANTAGPTLVFSFIGFEETEVSAGTREQVDVRLTDDITELSEVVVVGYAVETDNVNVSNLEFAAPAGGRRAFEQYLDLNLQYPTEALDNNVEGKVTIQFAVEATGELNDFKVVRGVGFGCDEEVIRLIKEGPGWTPTKRNNSAVRDLVKVRMKFALPKK